MDNHSLYKAVSPCEVLSTSMAVINGTEAKVTQEVLGTTIVTPDKPGKQRPPYQKQKLRNGFKRRAAIKPKIEHLKQDHRLSRNYYKGIKGDNINVMLAATAMNFKRMINRWKINPLVFLAQLFKCLSSFVKNTKSQIQNLLILKLSF